MAFDITSVLKGVSGPDAGKEQIEYIPVDQIDPDPNNFYSLDGLDELAGNIELIGSSPSGCGRARTGASSWSAATGAGLPS